MNIAVFCGSSLPRNTRFVDAARELGRAIAEGGHTLLYGGSNLGLMGEVSGGAIEAGGTVIAVIPTFFSEEIINSQTVSEIVRVSSMAERKEYLIAHSDAFIALPGGIGTLDEVSEVMVANQLQHLGRPMILLNLDEYYVPFLAQLDTMRAEGLLRADGGLRVAGDVNEAISVFNMNSHELPIN